MHCGAHTEAIEEYTMTIFEGVEKAAQECLPCTSGGKKMSRSDIVPGWTEYVKPFSDESKFWCSVWLSAGNPGQGSLYDVRLATVVAGLMIKLAQRILLTTLLIFIVSYLVGISMELILMKWLTTFHMMSSQSQCRMSIRSTLI